MAETTCDVAMEATPLVPPVAVKHRILVVVYGLGLAVVSVMLANGIHNRYAHRHVHGGSGDFSAFQIVARVPQTFRRLSPSVPSDPTHLGGHRRQHPHHSTKTRDFSMHDSTVIPEHAMHGSVTTRDTVVPTTRDVVEQQEATNSGFVGHFPIPVAAALGREHVSNQQHAPGSIVFGAAMTALVLVVRSLYLRIQSHPLNSAPLAMLSTYLQPKALATSVYGDSDVGGELNGRKGEELLRHHDYLGVCMLPLMLLLNDGTVVEVDFIKTDDERDTVRQMLNDEIEEGQSWPFDQPLDENQFKSYFMSHAAFVIRAHNACLKDGSSIKPVEGKAESQILGAFYIKPNFPGRCSHVCNGGFLTRKDVRRQGVGFAMGKAFLRFARLLGYRTSFFNLCFTTNQASIKLWSKLGFTPLARISGIAKLPGSDEYVDAIQFQYDLTTVPSEASSDFGFDFPRDPPNNPNNVDLGVVGRRRWPQHGPLALIGAVIFGALMAYLHYRMSVMPLHLPNDMLLVVTAYLEAMSLHTLFWYAIPAILIVGLLKKYGRSLLAFCLLGSKSTDEDESNFFDTYLQDSEDSEPQPQPQP